MGQFIVDSFSGDAAMLPRKHRTEHDVLAALSSMPRVSTWDMSEFPWLRNRVAALEKRGCIVIDEERSSFPWIMYEITERGHAALASDASAA